MSENRRSEGRLVTLQFCTAASNIPAGTPLAVMSATSLIYTLGLSTTGFGATAGIGSYFAGISDEDLSAGDSPVTLWVEGVFELTAASAWSTAYVGDAVMPDSGRVCVVVGVTGTPPIGSYIPAGTGERSGTTILVKIKPAIWEWDTYGLANISGTGGSHDGKVFPRAL